MAGLLRIFKSKKAKKEEEDNSEDLAREVSNRRSFRAPSSSSKSQRRLVAHFAEDAPLSATAAYHTTNAPKLRKGPQSCPGGYQDESDQSFESEKHSKKSSAARRRDVLSQSMRQNYTIDEGGRSKSSGGRRHHSGRGDFRRRGESSEYGSGDPSPVGQYSSRHSHYEDRIEESENDDFTEKDQFAVLERSQKYYMQKYKESELKRREEKRRFKDMERDNNDTKNRLLNMMHQLDNMKKERDYYRKELSRTKKQLEATQISQNNGFDSYNLLRQQQAHQNPQQFPQSLTMPYSFINQSMTSSHLHQPNYMMTAPPSSNTPVTMTSGGAGESLTNPSDVSFLHSSFLQQSSQVMTGTTPSPAFKVPSFPHEEENDEIKNFRGDLQIEMARDCADADHISISPSSSADSQVTLLDQSTIDKENRKPPTRPFSMMSI
ncbi:unnamed protein product [Caenorhabditis sp. 36 PRJEB53466]|nr:unnamed protein product [Caenorhabditis sp. 36 PRJEB53466]